MAKNDKMTHLMKKAAPFISGLAGDVNADTVDKDLEALVLALNAHKTSADHDGAAHVWAEVQQFLKTMVTTSILPSLAETYDIGSDTHRFRKGFFSELSSLIFKKDNIIVLDGRLLISKMAGVLPAAVLSTDLAIDFGETMIPGDVLLLRSEGQIEYIEVGTLKEEKGTLYNVTRDLDGSGANDWPEGEPFAVLGSEGDGWLEISAVDERRFSVYAMGATFNAAMEIARYGEIVGWQNAGFSGVGLAFGDFANNKYFVSTDADGMVAVGLSLKIGTGEKDIDLTGIQIDDTEIVGQENGVDQVVIGADGKLIAGEGNVRIDENGVSINAPYADELWSEPASLTIKDFDLDDFAIGRLRGYTAYGMLKNKFVLLEALSNNDVFGSILVLSSEAKVEGNGAAIRIRSKSGSSNPNMELDADVVYLKEGCKLQDSNGNEYGRPVFLTTPLTSTSWDGDNKSTSDRAIVDLSAVFGVPAGVKAVMMSIQTQGDAANDYIRFGPNSSYTYALTCRTQVAGQIAHASGIVPCDANGDVYCYPSGTIEAVYVWIWGYFL